MGDRVRALCRGALLPKCPVRVSARLKEGIGPFPDTRDLHSKILVLVLAFRLKPT